jgi:hypothetical protein
MPRERRLTAKARALEEEKKLKELEKLSKSQHKELLKKAAADVDEMTAMFRNMGTSSSGGRRKTRRSKKSRSRK